MKEQFLPQLEYLRRSSDYSGKHFKVIGALRGSLSTDNCQTHSPTGDRSTILCLLLITKFSSNKITGKDVGILSVNGTGILGEISGVSQTSRTYDPPMTCSGAITLSYRRLEGAQSPSPSSFRDVTQQFPSQPSFGVVTQSALRDDSNLQGARPSKLLNLQFTCLKLQTQFEININSINAK